MKIERLHQLFDASPDSNVLEWSGICSDCGVRVVVVAKLTLSGIKISGGALYEPHQDEFHIKCESCHEKQPELTNYQPCEVYSRVVGYLRPVSQWNDGKQSEYRDRKTFEEVSQCL